MEGLRARLAAGGTVAIGVLLFDVFEPLDVFGPLELLGTVRPDRGSLQLVLLSEAETRRAVPAFGPLTLTDRCIYDARAEDGLDVLLIPGGMGTRRLQADGRYIARVGELAAKAQVVLTVCTGAWLLARTGLLDGRRATTNKWVFHQVVEACPKVQWQSAARWCTDGKFYTSSGVAAGTDLAYAFLQELVGADVARDCAEAAEYVPNTDPGNDPFAAAGSPGQRDADLAVRNRHGRPLRVLLVLYDQFEMMDTFGPLEMFGMANLLLSSGGLPAAFELTTLAEDRTVRAFRGPTVRADLLYRELEGQPLGYDMLLIPGGVGTLREVHSPVARRWLPLLAAKSDMVVTVCSGSTILGSMGILDGVRATSNKMAFDLLAEFAPSAHWVPEARWVSHGKFRTSSGVSAGTDLALHLLQELFGEDLARAVARRAEYPFPEGDGSADPFAGSIPKPTWRRRLFVRAQRWALRMVFAVGFSLGFRMHITAALV